MPPPTRPHATQAAPASSASARKRWEPGGTPPRQCTSLTTTHSASTRSRTASPATRPGRSPAPQSGGTRCCCTSPTSTSTASRSSSKPTSCWPCTGVAMRSRRSRRHGISTTTKRSRFGTRHCRPAPRLSSPPRWAYPRLAYDYLAEAALMDLDDFEHDTRDGLHIAALAGSWIALVAGLGGMRQRGDTLHFAPRLPEGLSRARLHDLPGGAAPGGGGERGGRHVHAARRHANADRSPRAAAHRAARRPGPPADSPGTRPARACAAPGTRTGPPAAPHRPAAAQARLSAPHWMKFPAQPGESAARDPGTNTM